MSVKRGTVCVIIAAWNASGTIARAIASALAEPEVCEVIVVDDASTDDTAVVSSAADDGTGRLKVIRQSRNGGPSAARNAALAASAAPYVAILDADDFFVPGRFATLFAQPGWDAIADNIVFIAEGSEAGFDPSGVRPFDPAPIDLSFQDFVEGNIPRRGQPRAELGFVKPVIRREFLDRHGLRYDERLRLGEDFALYARLLAAGGRFTLIRTCGYVAVERRNSLSGLHATADLEALLAFDRGMAGQPGLAAEDRNAIERHAAQLADNFHHRHFLDEKRRKGMARALFALASRPQRFVRTARSIARDKFASRATPAHGKIDAVRYLLS